ncbi:MAG: hypothetical protein DWI10_04535 [Planctomycetota bacterium]|jgi:hypothetical protein|nr:MAG: hypothetical protein DWI10_04535 [Planctomycetota bacterium]
MSKHNKKNAKKQDAVVTEASALPTSTAATDSVATTAKAERKAAQKSEKAVAKQVKAAKAAAAVDCRMPAFKHARKKKLSSGKGPSPLEVGQSLVSLFNAGKSEEAESTWYHRKIESIEGDGTVYEGWKGVLEKSKWWKENFTVLSMQAEGPFVCATGFTVIYKGRVRMSDGVEVDAHEVGVYTVAKGRIVREQFMDRAR